MHMWLSLRAFIQLTSQSEGGRTHLVSSLQMTLRKACSDTETSLRCDRGSSLGDKCANHWASMLESPGGGGGGGVLWYFNTYVGSGHSFFGFKILNFNIFGGFQINEYFLGYEDFLGSSRNWTIISIHHIYINCWFPLYRWSVMEKQVTSTPPIPGNGGGGVLVTCIYITDHL